MYISTYNTITYIRSRGGWSRTHGHCIFLRMFHVSPYIGYNTNISTGGVEWGRLNIWIVLHVSFKAV